MADSIKIGNLDISAFKVGSGDCAIYLGDTLLYSGGTPPPTPTLQWVTFTNELPPHDESGMAQIYGIRFNSLDVDSCVEGISILNEITETSATIEGAGRGRVNFNSWDGCDTTSSSDEDIEMDFTNGYTDDCDNVTEPPYYLDCWASVALSYITYQLLIYQ